MTWTYTNNPATVTLDAVRLLIGDTDTNDQLLSDEEIAYFLTQTGSDEYRAAALCCESVVAKLSKDVDRTLGTLSVRSSQRVDQYTKLAALMRAKAKIGGKPYFGGLSQDELDADELDTDLLMPTFKRDMMKYN